MRLPSATSALEPVTQTLIRVVSGMVDISLMSKTEFLRLKLIKVNQGSTDFRSGRCEMLGITEDAKKFEIKFQPSETFHVNGMTGWLERGGTVRDVNS